MSNLSTLDQRDIFLGSCISRLAYCNPFIPERVTIEKAILGTHFQDHGSVWHSHNPFTFNPNIDQIQEVAGTLLSKFRAYLLAGNLTPCIEIQEYIGLGFYYLYQKFEKRLHGLIKGQNMKVAWYSELIETYQHFFSLPQVQPHCLTPATLFSCFWQIRRAFHCIFSFIVGRSTAVAELRARIWQSIFTHDMHRYQKGLFLRMGDLTALVTGPSGTGKELVAKALGYARFIPFDENTLKFKADYRKLFSALNLSALSPTLLEAELFGHRKGSFTGAISDRAGWFESCPPFGTVFLDEIGELEPPLQVKILRVLQVRTFQRLGETIPRHFEGKVIAATNRNLAEAMLKGRFREDLYYRLCADQIETPSLLAQIENNHDELLHLVEFIAKEVAGPELGETLAEEAADWIQENLPSHSWPGNFRELEQCVRNIMIGGKYIPKGDVGQENNHWLQAKRGRLTAEKLLSLYCLQVYRKTGSFQATAKIVELDRRTVKSKVEFAKNLL